MGNQQGQPGASSQSQDIRDGQPFSRERVLLKQAFKKWTGGSSETISEVDFLENSFPSHRDYGTRLFRHFIRRTGGGSTVLTEAQYVDESLNIYQTGSIPPVEVYFQIFAGNDTSIKKDDAAAMFESCLKLSWALSQHCVSLDVTPLINAMVSSLVGRSEDVSLPAFTSWYGRNCRQLLAGLHQFTSQKLVGWTGNQEKDPPGASSQPLEPVSEVVNHVQKAKGLLNAATVWALSASLPASYIPTGESDALLSGPSFENALLDILSPSGWHRLYDSNSQGLSVRSFQHSVLEYKGPTVFLISFQDHVYCLAADTEWREGLSNFGSGDCCLIQILPKFTLMQSGANMLYLNFTDSRSPRGLHVGKDSRTTFLTIDGDFSKVMHYGVPYDLHILEVWGCGGLSVKDAQLQQRDWEKRQVQKSKDRKIKLDDWKDSPDRQILEMGGVSTEHAQQ